MSTKFSNKQIDIAKGEFKSASRKFWSRKRITKQVRIGVKNHRKYRKFAKENKVTLSKLLDKVLKMYAKDVRLGGKK